MNCFSPSRLQTQTKVAAVTMDAKLLLLLGNDSGTCPDPSKQTPLGKSSGSSHTSSPHTHPGKERQNICSHVRGPSNENSNACMEAYKDTGLFERGTHKKIADLVSRET